MDDDVAEILRFAVKYKPKMLCIEYRKNSGVTFVKKIHIKSPASNIDQAALVDKLISKNYSLLGPEKANRDQIEDLVSLLISFADDNVIENDSNSSKSSNVPTLKFLPNSLPTPG